MLEVVQLIFPTVLLAGRLQWLTIPEIWAFFTEKPENDEYLRRSSGQVLLHHSHFKNDILSRTRRFFPCSSSCQDAGSNSGAASGETESLCGPWPRHCGPRAIGTHSASIGLGPVRLGQHRWWRLTIIEALEREIVEPHIRARFGIVLLTPDDMGNAQKDGELHRQPRARQNVVLEMGMVLAALGRSNVAILRKGHLETPSDAQG